MKITTISFEIQDQTMAVSSNQRIEFILKAVKKEKPDLFLTSGYSLDTNADLNNLVEKLTSEKLSTNILVEVKVDDIVIKNGHPLQKSSKKKIFETGTHCMYLIKRNYEVIRLGAQIFAQSQEVSGKDKFVYINKFHEQLNNRTFDIEGKKAFALCCGEINTIQGRDNIKFISSQTESILKSCDIIMNPTHDIMANYGTLKAKRKFLSKMNHNNSIYISSSNWNTHKTLSNGKVRIQNQRNSFIQNVYQNGMKQIMTTIESNDRVLLNSVILNN